MKQNFTLLQSAVRHLRLSTTTNVKAFLLQHHPHTQQHHARFASAYQQFDGSPLIDPQRQQQPQQIVRLPTQNKLQKIVQKCVRHFHQNTNSSGRTRPQFREFSSISSSNAPPPTSISKCWNCSVPQSGKRAATVVDLGVFCPECGIIQDLPENSADEYFALFGLERAFTLNAAELTRKFRQLQGVIHPDKFSNRSEREQQLSADWSALVNSAYKTLLAPIKRGEYILRQHGMQIPEGNTAVGSAFLMEMMERNEEVDDAHAADELLDLQRRVQDDLAAVVAKLDASLLANELDRALADLITLRYLCSLETSIKTKCQRLGVVV